MTIGGGGGGSAQNVHHQMNGMGHTREFSQNAQNAQNAQKEMGWAPGFNTPCRARLEIGTATNVHLSIVVDRGSLRCYFGGSDYLGLKYGQSSTRFFMAFS